MRFFSERYGLAPVRLAIQIDSMDDALRVGLWNCLSTHQFARTHTDPYSYGRHNHFPDDELDQACRLLWLYYFKKPVDTKPSNWDGTYEQMRTYFFAAPWNEVYDFIEFFLRAFPDADMNERFRNEVNETLEREQSAYRFVNGTIQRVTDQTEIDSIEQASDLPAALSLVSTHLAAAQERLGDRKKPDYRNSIKESISAVEAMCALITGQSKSDLTGALQKLEKTSHLHPSLKRAFANLYGYTSDSNGIRHALLDEPDLTFDDAKFMLVACSAFINYLKALIARERN